MRYDAHTHSTYSDGSFLWSMLSAAEAAGLAGVGVTDHCNVSERDRPRTAKRAMGFNLDVTYERRRAAIDHLRDQFDLRVFDGVEMDFDERDVDAIEGFLEEAAFEYAIGSVHVLDGVNVHIEPHFAEKSEMERREHVAEYFDRLVALVESGLFEIAAHPDLVERNPALRGFATDEEYRRVAEAFADSRTVPELNAGRVLDDYGRLHPTTEFVEVLADYEIPFVLGTDSHDPEKVEPRREELEAFVAEHDVETVELPALVD